MQMPGSILEARNLDERVVAIVCSPGATVYRFRRNGGILHTHYANIGTRNNSLFIETRARTTVCRLYRARARYLCNVLPYRW